MCSFCPVFSTCLNLASECTTIAVGQHRMSSDRTCCIRFTATSPLSPPPVPKCWSPHCSLCSFCPVFSTCLNAASECTTMSVGQHRLSSDCTCCIRFTGTSPLSPPPVPKCLICTLFYVFFLSSLFHVSERSQWVYNDGCGPVPVVLWLHHVRQVYRRGERHYRRPLHLPFLSLLRCQSGSLWLRRLGHLRVWS